MEYHGKLQRWNDEKGFGFIASETKGQNNVFLHISELKNMGRRPVEGDIIFYQLYTESSGKTKAINARIDGVLLVKPRTKSEPKQEKNSFVSGIIGIIFITVIAWFAYDKFNKTHSVIEASALVISQTPPVQAAKKDYVSTYQCDGRQHCSQMSSCAEATFFINNCPDTKMDGDGDGIPCEEQWCSH